MAGFAHIISFFCPANNKLCARLAESFHRLLKKCGTRYLNKIITEILQNILLKIRSDLLDTKL